MHDLVIRNALLLDGLALMPGIIDNHTHYDAQLTWDPLASRTKKACGRSTSFQAGFCVNSTAEIP